MEVDTLPYDDEAGSKLAEEEANSLQNRIGKGRLYLLADSSASIHARLLTKPSRKRTRKDDEDVMEDPELSERLYNPPPETARANAILFRGDPISVLPTQRVLSYAASISGMPPLGLEWVDDINVVVVWETAESARRAYIAMRVFDEETLEEDVEREGEEGFVVARPIPETLWPMDARLQKVLGKDAPGGGSSVEEGIEIVKRPLQMRWARPEDVKERGARNKSKFYERHGSNAGKESQNIFAPEERASGTKRKREDWEEDEAEKRRRLDEELDLIHAQSPHNEEPRRSASPPPRGYDNTRRKRRRRSYSPHAHGRDRGSPDAYANFNKSKRQRAYGATLSEPYPAGVREWDIGKIPNGRWEHDAYEEDEFGRERSATSGGRRSQGRREGRNRGKGDRRDPAVKEDLDAELDAYASRA